MSCICLQKLYKNCIIFTTYKFTYKIYTSLTCEKNYYLLSQKRSTYIFTNIILTYTHAHICFSKLSPLFSKCLIYVAYFKSLSIHKHAHKCINTNIHTHIHMCIYLLPCLQCVFIREILAFFTHNSNLIQDTSWLLFSTVN